LSHLLELLGRGLDCDLGDLLDRYYWTPQTQSTQELAETARQHPDWPDIRLRLGLACLRGMQLPEAIEHLSAACRRKPDYVAARLALAAACESAGDVPKAVDHLRLANQVQPGRPAVLFAMGFCLERLRQPAAAMDYYRDAIAADSGFLPARQRLAAAAVAVNDLQEAVSQYEAIRLACPQDSAARASLANLYYRAGRWADAVAEYEQAIAMEPENWALLDDEVEALAAAGQLREAIERLHSLLGRQGEFPDTNVRLGDLYSQCGDDQAATRHYLAAIDLQPRYLEAMVKLGTHHLLMGRWDEAAESFSRANELNDSLLASYIGLGVAHEAAGRHDEALQSLELAAAVEPNSTLLLSEVARLQLKSALAQEFAQSFDEGEPCDVAGLQMDNDELLATQVQRHAEQVHRHGDHADLRYRYGVLLRAQGRQGEAMEQFAKALEINPSYVQAMLKLGITQQELGRVDDAIATLTRAVELAPDYVDLHYRLGLLYCDRRDFAQAAREMETAAGGATDNERIRCNLALSLQNLGLLDRASATWRSLARVHQVSRNRR
jgi:tetratricopeptide (TPR) repeat protein